MTAFTEMDVRIGLPGTVLFDGPATRLGAVAEDGGFGLLPNHIDWVTALVPSVLTLTQPGGTERVFGMDEGVLVKTGDRVRIAVRRGVEGADLRSLQATVDAFFDAVEDEERVARAALSRLEADMVRRFAGLRGQP
ncbi:ATPase [Jannaschia rubra]|uniref:F0F1 ATP synthase subunit epsilon n=1 Tax=Jannaschia rubra TaxID=282197 RepID=A0A0M6XRG1_9RHOB|nr:ATPase [Jannaschia rubra]CTQ33302.1 F0F1 ATP synthase subunit epsilon [Jannaschia rubra]SFF98780.1 F-type H+-transporting ATPase subunit epsilon [Jannaschia rubra]